jgi:hypothetical protein
MRKSILLASAISLLLMGCSSYRQVARAWAAEKSNRYKITLVEREPNRLNKYRSYTVEIYGTTTRITVFCGDPHVCGISVEGEKISASYDNYSGRWSRAE